MANEYIELAKNYDPKKLAVPSTAQQKYDGVPAYIKRFEDGSIHAFTRQGEPIQSINHVLEAARPILLLAGSFIVGELYDPSIPFKTISGQVRDTKQQHSNLRLHVFDGDLLPALKRGWYDRYQSFEFALSVALQVTQIKENSYPIARIGGCIVTNTDMVPVLLEAMQEAIPNVEGLMLHDHNKRWSPGKRCWGTMRVKPQPTIDLKVVGFEEAIDQDGNPKGMVGRINVEYGDKVIGIGPGKLTHDQRIKYWNHRDFLASEEKIAEIKYMPDPTYDALRQPTFQRWRPDKTVADAVL